MPWFFAAMLQRRNQNVKNAAPSGKHQAPDGAAFGFWQANFADRSVRNHNTLPVGLPFGKLFWFGQGDSLRSLHHCVLQFAKRAANLFQD